MKKEKIDRDKKGRIINDIHSQKTPSWLAISSYISVTEKKEMA